MSRKLNPLLDTDGSSPSGLVVMVGFGRNRFGRFSLTATYDPTKGTLIGEKRYMTSKSSTIQRKGKKSQNEVGGEPPITRPRNSSSVVLDILDISGTVASSGGRRKRSKSRSDTCDYEPDSLDETGVPSTKRRGSRGTTEQYPVVPEGAPPFEQVYREPLEDGDDEEYRNAYYDNATGEIYEGGWNKGYRHGRGVCLYADGSMYEGMWVKGKEHGRGQLMMGDTRKVLYVGEWQEGAMHGTGTYNFYSGDKYHGDFREGARHGKGEFYSREGCTYVGDWKDNKRCGRGLFTWPDGSFYDGEWDNDTRHGKGRLRLSTGFEYDGTWVLNALDGRGITHFPSGQKYEGSFKAGMREGRGSITFAEGAVYEGRFRDDHLDGQGTIKVSDNVPGVEDGEKLIPIEIQADIRRIHLKAGFGAPEHH